MYLCDNEQQQQKCPELGLMFAVSHFIWGLCFQMEDDGWVQGLTHSLICISCLINQFINLLNLFAIHDLHRFHLTYRNEWY